jgi:hypothetical protein
MVEFKEEVSYEIEQSPIIAQEMIEKILFLVSESIYDIEIKIVSKPYGINYMTSLFLSLVEWNYLRYDTEDTIECEEFIEPIPPKIDSWARGVVPVRKEYKKFVEPLIVPLLDSKPSTGVFKSNFTGCSSRVAKDIIIQEYAEGVPMDVPDCIISDHEEFLRSKKQKQIQMKAQEILRLKQQKLKEKQASEAILTKFRGAIPEFTYDYKGNMIFTSPFEHKKPSTRVNYKVIESHNNIFSKHSQIKHQAFSSVSTLSKPSKAPSVKLEPLETNPLNKLKSPIALDNIFLSPKVKITYSTLASSYAAKPSLSQKTIVPKPPSFPIESQNFDYGYFGGLNTLQTVPEFSMKSSGFHKIQTNSGADTDKKIKKKGDKVIKYSKDMKIEDNASPVHAFNLNIINDKNWGTNPTFTQPIFSARLPKAYTAKDKLDLLKLTTKKNQKKTFASPISHISLQEKIKKSADFLFK